MSPGWTLLAGAVILALAALAGCCWWGSGLAFSPPKMLPMEIWPDKFGLSYEPVAFRSADGVELKGWLIPAGEATDKTIVMFHGWGDNKGDLLEGVWRLASRFNLFLFDFRHHGESGGSANSIGALETRDTEAALEFLGRARPAWASRLAAFGLSMGANVALWAAARHPEIRGVAVEAPFPSFNRVVTRWTANEFRLPYFPFVWLTLVFLRWRLGFDHEPFSARYHAPAVSPRALLVIAGELDRLMPLADVREVFEGAGEPKEIWVIPGAEHGRCHEAAAEDYPRRLQSFFDKVLS